MIHSVKAFLTHAVLPAALIVATGYNAAMMANGPDGRRAGEAVLAEAEAASERLAELRERNGRLAARADGLMLASLDEDLLEERLRARLGLTRPGEYMVRMGDLDRIAGTERHEDDRTQLAELSR